MKVSLLLILFFFLAVSSKGQMLLYKFRIRYEDYNFLTNKAFVINGERLATDNQGIIDLKIPAAISFVYIESANKDDYHVKFPAEGRALLPKDHSVFVDIFIAKADKAAAISRDDFKKLSSQLAASQSTAEAKLLKKLGDESRRAYDSVLLLLSKGSIKNGKLIEGRLQFLPLISGALNHYLNELRDFRDAFSTLASHPGSRQSYEQFALAVYNYNQIFELLNTNKSTYEQAISTYWKSKELGLKFSNLIDYTIEEIHKPYVLDINYSFIERFYSYRREDNRRKKSELEDTLNRDATQHINAMDRRITSLGERISSLNTFLNNYSNTAENL